jgi:acetyl-CoA carboxylase biotin carboxyl carrier protein
MDIDEIKTLTDLMVENDLAEIMIRDGEKEILLRRSGVTCMTTQAHAPVQAPVAAQPLFVAPAPSAAPQEVMPAIKSPMVGTYYASPDPESGPFVSVGATVGPETVVCIIEAMKVFNEIKAEVAGVIESIEVSNGSPVDYGQILMKVRPR